MIESKRIADGVESFAARTPTLPPATHTESYALGGREVILVEPATPFDDEQRDWLAWVDGLRSRGRSIVGLLATHHHPDHVGGVGFFASALGVPLIAHGATADRLSVTVDQVVHDGDALTLDGPVPQRWEVLHTPGHAPGHVCLFEPDLGHLVVGDMVATVGTILVAPGDGDMAEYVRQLRRLAAVGARVALPAHGAPIRDPRGHFEHYVEHRLMRERKVLDAVGAASPAGASPEELLPVAYDDTPERAYPLALLSLRAHLDKLEQEGRVLIRQERYVLSGEPPA